MVFTVSQFIPRGCDPIEFNNDVINPADKANIIEEFPQIVGKKVLTIPGRIQNGRV